MGGQRASALPSHTGTLVEAAMKSIMLVTPVFRRFELTRIMLEHRVETFKSAQALGVSCGCVVVGDAPNLAVAEGLGFDVIEAPNLLGSKYNDGHQFSVENGWGISFQVNSDQVFDPHLLLELSRSPDDKLIQTEWLTAVHGTGKRLCHTRIMCGV